jgi:anti-sigma-K factor RskA
MNEHPQDSIPAFVLGTLDVDEALLVSDHVLRCPVCRAEVEAFHSVLGALPYAAPPQDPPAHVKQQLSARIAATAAPRQRSRARPRLVQAISAGAVALSLVFAVMLVDLNSRISAVTTQFQQSRQAFVQMQGQFEQAQQALARISHESEQAQLALTQLRNQLAQDQQVTMFIAAPKTVHCALNGVDQRASATMYMQPDNKHAVLVVEGMPRVAQGKTYQFWLVNKDGQVPSVTFDGKPDGMAVLKIEAPSPVNHYDQVMVTVEQSGGAQHPSAWIVLRGWVSAARAVRFIS